MSCEEEKQNPNKNITLEAFSSMRKSEYAVNSHSIRTYLEKLVKNDRDSLAASSRVRGYYRAGRPFLWIDRHGIDERADTMLSYIASVASMGLSTEVFCMSQIERDLKRVRELDVDDADKDINKLLARIEYNLTKACLRFGAGMKYGFVNPEKVLNEFDVREADSLHVVYHRLYDVKTSRPNDGFYESLLGKVAHDSIGIFLSALEPTGRVYKLLKQRLAGGDVSSSLRAKILCNMERQRWRQGNVPDELKKYVLVNIPAFKLYAVCPDSAIEMRVGCGTVKTKTPLLTSEIKRMDINPQWIVPKSIVEKEVARHAGNVGYFERQRMFVRERRTGKKIPPQNITWSMLHSDKYTVVQEGGQGNSLGRIIFRFDNNFSVFLHDTSSRSFFSRDNRGVSHGCVRVEHPLELAIFLLDDKDNDTIEKIAYSMTARLSPKHIAQEGDEEEEDDFNENDTIDRAKLISTLDVGPHVPIFITYYTLYPNLEGQLREYPDVYGYDRVIYQNLRHYVQ